MFSLFVPLRTCVFLSSFLSLLVFCSHIGMTVERVLPSLLNAAGNLCFFLYLALRGIGETFSYLSFFICVCSRLCLICGVRFLFLFFICVLPVQPWQKKPPPPTTTTTPLPPPPSVSPINCLSHPDNDPFIGEKRGKWCRNGGTEGREDCVEKRGSAGGLDGDEMSI